jgi:hypothetical protein
MTTEIVVILGAVAGALLLMADFLFLPYWPRPLLDTTLRTTPLAQSKVWQIARSMGFLLFDDRLINARKIDRASIYPYIMGRGPIVALSHSRREWLI